MVGKFVTMYQIRLRCVCEHVLWFCGITSGDILGGLYEDRARVSKHANDTFYSLDVVMSGLGFELQPTHRLFLTGNVHDFCGRLCPHSDRNLPPLYPH